MALFTTIIQYGKMRQTARVASEKQDFDIGDHCIIKTDRGTEWATIVSVPLPAEDLRKVSQYNIVRKATENDYAHRDRIPNIEMEFMHKADGFVLDQKLDMNLVSCEVLYGGERIIAYFQSENRVDFRKLVRDLGSTFSTRVEMRQLGDREVARLLGDIDTCGLTLCCLTHLKKFKPITMKMARIQLSSLNSDKLSGQCGRLKCCLRYEYDQYLELVENLPGKKKKIKLSDGTIGTVVDQNVLEQTITLDVQGEKRLLTANDYLTMLDQDPSKAKSCDNQGKNGQKGDCVTSDCGGRNK